MSYCTNNLELDLISEFAIIPPDAVIKSENVNPFVVSLVPVIINSLHVNIFDT